MERNDKAESLQRLADLHRELSARPPESRDHNFDRWAAVDVLDLIGVDRADTSIVASPPDRRVQAAEASDHADSPAMRPLLAARVLAAVAVRNVASGADKIFDAIDGMREPVRTIAFMRFGGDSYSYISESLGIPEGMAWFLSELALDQLQQMVTIEEPLSPAVSRTRRDLFGYDGASLDPLRQFPDQ